MTTNDQLRIEFAERLGWTRIERGCISNISGKSLLGAETDWMGTPPDDSNKAEDDQRFRRIPNPTSHTDVHNAMMGMSEEEWKKFVRQFLTSSFAWHENYSYELVKSCFCAPLSTLVECFLEATKGRVK